MVEDRGGNFILDDLVPDEYVVSPCHDHLHEIKVIAEGRFFDRYTGSGAKETDEDSIETSHTALLTAEDKQPALGTGGLESNSHQEMSATESWTQETGVDSAGVLDTAGQAEEGHTCQSMEGGDLHGSFQASLGDQGMQVGNQGDQNELGNTQDCPQTARYARYFTYVTENEPTHQNGTEGPQLTGLGGLRALSLLEFTGDVRAVDFDLLNREICFQRG
ncbi:unnamed protein product [Hydatigera taeniaeformis]|uniref:Uncharacterized protein n=1 Tax=Hydatigena taeniaeformis TaxID=6205 RepID=A0A0R3X3X8_HYDTA|nr:unnamed protein product [Hydatigera taeniaeformis]